MADWESGGLPPVARARIDRAASSDVRTSLLSASEMVTVGDAGFEPVGEVMGVVVSHLGFGGYGCGVWSGWGNQWSPATTVTSSGGGYGGYAPYVNALYAGYDGALRRCLLEAQALGADGVVGVRWTHDVLDDVGSREFVAMGTAVRARSTSRPAHLFATDLPGQDLAKLMHSGWVPSGLVTGIAVAIRHDDYYTRQQARSWTGGNYEVQGYTELVTYVRADARHQFAQRAARHGGDSAIVSSMSLSVWEIEPADNHRDHIAQSIVVGTPIAKVAARGTRTARPLTVLPLTGTRGRSSR